MCQVSAVTPQQSTPAPQDRATVDFWFDPTCPWAWMTSRWMEEVQRVRDVDVRWHVLSLAVLNEGRDLPEDYRRTIDRAWGYARVATAAGERHGQEAIKAVYDAIGTRVHPGRRKDQEQVVVEALREAGLPADLAQVADTDEVDQAMRASTARALELVGDDVGVPVIAIDGVAFFGPVISPAPKGEDAGRLWDGCLLVARTPGFFELKRSRTVDPIFD